MKAKITIESPETYKKEEIEWRPGLEIVINQRVHAFMVRDEKMSIYFTHEMMGDQRISVRFEE